MKLLTTILLSIFILFTSYANASPLDNAVILDGGDSKYGVVLAHGKGKHPTWLVVNPLRKGINEELGYHTISLQMPTGYDHWKDYADGFDDAFASFRSAIDYLKSQKGVSKVYLIGHSMGSRMASAYIDQNSDHGIAGLVVAGCRNNGGSPLACDQNLQGVTIPVLDIWGGNNGKDSRAASERTDLISNSYKQVEVYDANHKFEGYEDELVEETVKWLKAQK